MSSSRMMAWMVWMIVSVFYAYQYILRVMPNIMLDDIMLQFNMDTATFGQFSGIYYIGYSLMHLPVGILLDRYGPKKVVPICILLSVIGLLPLYFSGHWMIPIMGRLLMGMGSSAAILGVFKIVRMTFKEEQFSRMLSLSVTIGLIGAIYGGGPVSYMRDTFGYQTVVEFFAIAGVMLAAFTYFIIPNSPTTVQESVKDDIKQVLTNGRVILTCLFAGLMVGPLEGFADVWGTVFLKQVYGFEGSIAASLPSMIFIGMCFGGPLLGLMAEKFLGQLPTVIGAGFTMAATFAYLVFQPVTPEILSLGFVVVGICCSYQILAIYKASTYVSENVAGLTTAVANMIIMIFGYAFHTTIGAVINYMGGPTSAQALTYGVAVVPLALVVGTIGFAFLWNLERVDKKKQIMVQT